MTVFHVITANTVSTLIITVTWQLVLLTSVASWIYIVNRETAWSQGRLRLFSERGPYMVNDDLSYDGPRMPYIENGRPLMVLFMSYIFAMQSGIIYQLMHMESSLILEEGGRDGAEGRNISLDESDLYISTNCDYTLEHISHNYTWLIVITISISILNIVFSYPKYTVPDVSDESDESYEEVEQEP